ncbi:GYDIA family GHMP kinase [Nonlabens xiamenensis]|uniref:GYDIA family GHMP kinase n=1 Tax=Nonlabens xiamenensis TaxID=2341043 RepID=UPI000F60C12B|nr:GYDIA family GHMP kinase [Nonlabens xiamenensis]
MEQRVFSAHGKFLITGEYAVLDAVPALAVPLKLDQRLVITPREDQQINWKSYDVDGSLWFELSTNVHDLYSDCIDCDNPISIKLAEILNHALHLSSIRSLHGFDAVTELDFDRKSGMGTSSTLISMIAQWLGCDPFALQFRAFGGSGYDVACATAQKPITYTYDPVRPKVETVNWDPAIKDELFFVYLNRKQNSRESIASYQSSRLTSDVRSRLVEMPKAFLNASNDLTVFKALIDEHEGLIAPLVGILPVKERLFADYPGSIKSLGGWGGDFVMATGGAQERDYFRQRNYQDIREWNELIR